MDELGWTKADLAEKSGVSYDSINKYLRGDTDQPRGNILQKLADAIGKPLLWLRDGLDPESTVTPARAGYVAGAIVGTVEAGAFREVDEFDQREREVIMVPADEKYPGARVLIFDVAGDSMNALEPRPILPGDRLQCLAYEDIGHHVDLRSGLIVVVQRTRDDGHIREWSVKQIELFADRSEFHPRSHNAKHKPIVVPYNPDADDGVKVEIIALVRRVINEMPGF